MAEIPELCEVHAEIYVFEGGLVGEEDGDGGAAGDVVSWIRMGGT